MAQDTSLARTNLTKTLKVTSLADLVRLKTAENPALLLDCSGSMKDHLRNGRSRIDMLGEVTRNIVKERDNIVMIAFHSEEAFIVTSAPSRASGGTPLHLAIDFAKEKGIARAIVISDGIPDQPQASLDAARHFGGKIDVVFVGNPGEHGEAFLRELAEATGGSEFHGDLSQPKELGAKIVGLLNADNPLDDDDDDED